MGKIEEIKKLSSVLKEGGITQGEYDLLKKKILEPISKPISYDGVNLNSENNSVTDIPIILSVLKNVEIEQNSKQVQTKIYTSEPQKKSFGKKILSETKECPYCGESILLDAIKCKYCNEFLKPNNANSTPALQKKENQLTADNIKGKKFDSINRIIYPLIIIILGWFILYFGGWQIIWKMKIDLLTQTLLTGNFSFQTENYFFLRDGFILRMNDAFYGFAVTNRFFDSPFIQWIMLFVGISIIWHGVSKIFN